MGPGSDGSWTVVVNPGSSATAPEAGDPSVRNPSASSRGRPGQVDRVGRGRHASGSGPARSRGVVGQGPSDPERRDAGVTDGRGRPVERAGGGRVAEVVERTLSAVSHRSGRRHEYVRVRAGGVAGVPSSKPVSTDEGPRSRRSYK